MIEIKFSSPAPFHLVALIVRLNPFLTNKKSANFGLEVPPLPPFGNFPKNRGIWSVIQTLYSHT